jgi:phospholipid/cholesterol/gamma-HCH transport system substrate-binding protein
MSFKISNPIRIAILGILALVAFITGFNFLKSRNTFNKDTILYALFDEANGLTPSSFVLYKGVNIGSVKEIILSKKTPGKVEVAFSVNEGINLPADSKVFVTSTDLLSGKVLAVQSGTASTYYKKGDYVNSFVESGSIDKLTSMVNNADSNTLKKIDNAVAKAGVALTSADATINNINSVIDESVKQNLKNSIEGLNKSVNDFNVLSSSLAQQRQKIATTIASLETFANNLNKNNGNINATVSNIKSTTDNIKVTTENLNKADISGTINTLKSTLTELNGTLDKVNENQGTLGMLVNDKKLYNDLQGSVASLNALLTDLKANPKRYLQFSVFSKKDKPAANTGIAQ